MLIDPAVSFAEFIKQDLDKRNLLNEKNISGKEEFFVSANPEQFKVSADLFYEVK